MPTPALLLSLLLDPKENPIVLTATKQQPRFSGVTMTNRKQELEKIAHQVKVLRAFTRDTGFFTTRSVGALCQSLSPDELATVAELSMTEPKQ
jgi:hypothetical protein